MKYTYGAGDYGDDKDKKEPDEDKEPKEGEEGEDGEGQEGKSKLSKKKKIIIIAVGVVVLLGAIGGGLFFSGIFGGHHGTQAESQQAPKLPQAVTITEFPAMTVNLNTGGRNTKYLKIKFTLDLPSESDKSAVVSRLPKITDALNTYLRELRSSDLVGSAGVYRLKEELQLRINKIIYPAKVNEVLIDDLQDQ